MDLRPRCSQLGLQPVERMSGQPLFEPRESPCLDIKTAELGPGGPGATREDQERALRAGESQ